MTQTEQFFYDHAGWSYNPNTETQEQGRERGSKELARAEQYGKDHDWTVAWEYEPDGGDSSFVQNWSEEEQAEWNASEHECLYACLRDADGVMRASLGGIFDPSQEYRRAVEAELALEALGEIEREAQDSAECEKLMAC